MLVLLLLLAAGLVFYALWPREPVYQGRDLGVWLQELVDLDKQKGEELPSPDWQARHQEATAAVRNIGSNALPHLLQRLRSAPSTFSWRNKIQELLDKQSLVKIQLPEPRDQSAQALAGFEALGIAASPALPALGDLLLKSTKGSDAGPAAACLCYIGAPALPVFARALTNSDPSVQETALSALEQLRAQLGAALLPVLMTAITSTNCQVQAEAVLVLGDLGPLAGEVVPWLETAMRDPGHPLAGVAMRVRAELDNRPDAYMPILAERLADTNYVFHAAFALARLGPPGVAPLLGALTNQNPAIRGAALEALSSRFRRSSAGSSTNSTAYRFPALSRFFDSRSRWAASRPLQVQLIALRLAALLNGTDPAIRLQIVQLLGGYGRHSALGLSRAAVDEDERVRKEAQVALARLDVGIQRGAVVRGPTDKKCIALVFTGHEYAEGGGVILDELARHSAHASFFLTGGFLANPAFRPLIQRLYKEGHYLGPHSDKHLLYCSWEEPQKTLITHEQFGADLTANLRAIDWVGERGPLPGYFVPPYEHYNLDIVEWAGEFFFITLNYTPGTRSNADYTGESDRNFVSSQAILDSIKAREEQDACGLNGFILLFHLGSGPGRADKFHLRFGELLDQLTAEGYQFVAVDELFDPQAALQRLNNLDLRPGDVRSLEAFRKRYGLSR